jgi:hypothetical protein
LPNVRPSQRPSSAALEFSRDPSAAANALISRRMLIRWEVVGWCAGVIVRRHKDARRIVDGLNYNFIAAYDIDGQEASHALRSSLTTSATQQLPARRNPARGRCSRRRWRTRRRARWRRRWRRRTWRRARLERSRRRPV